MDLAKLEMSTKQEIKFFLRKLLVIGKGLENLLKKNNALGLFQVLFAELHALEEFPVSFVVILGRS